MFQQETWDFICAHRTKDVHQLALKKPTNDLVDLKQALVQIEGYQTARRKLPQWADTPKIIFRHASPWNSVFFVSYSPI